MKTVKLFLKRMLTLMLLLTVVLSVSVQPVSARDTDDDGEWEKLTHIGKYYFKYNNKNSRVYISKHKNRGFRKTPVNNEFFVSNGKQIIYVAYGYYYCYIKSYDIRSKKVKKVRQLPDKKVGVWVVEGASGGNILLRCSDNIYSYNVKTQKVKLIKKHIYPVEHLYGSYYFLQSSNEKRFEPKDSTHKGIYNKSGIYKMTKGGKLKLKKSLGNVYLDLFVGNGKSTQIYYTKSKEHDLYRIKWNGKKNKQVAHFRGYIRELMDRYCVIEKNGNYYEYYYKTKKYVKIDNYY